MPGRHLHPLPRRLAYTVRRVALRTAASGVDLSDRSPRHVAPAPRVGDRRERDDGRQWNGPEPAGG